MRLTTFILAITCSVFLTTSVLAQNWPNTADIITRMQTDLTLEQLQFDKVKSIIEENMTKRQQVRPQLAAGLTQAQSEPLDSELYAQLSEVLTREQMSRWNKTRRLMLEETASATASE